MRVLLHVGVIAALALNAEAQVCTTTIQLSTAQDILAVIQNIGDSVKSISGDVAAAQKQVTALLNQASPPPPPTMPPAGKTTISCQKIPSHGKLRACFSVEGYDNTKKTWTSQGMNGKDGKPFVAKLTGNGIGVGTDKNGQKGLHQDMKYVYGRYSDKFESPDILGLNAGYTVCSATRYNGARRGRILNGGTGNWLHGHWNQRAGIAHYNQWQGGHNGRVARDDWVFMCTYNSQGTKSIVINGRVYSASGGRDLQPKAININSGKPSGCCAGESSDWAMALLVTYDGHLSTAEMVSVEKYMGEGNMAPTSAPSKTTILCKNLPSKTKLKACFDLANFNARAMAFTSTVGSFNAQVGGSGYSFVTERANARGNPKQLHYVKGTTATTMVASGVVSGAYTVCSTTRYVGGTSGRILNGGSGNWLHGHWASRAGIAHYNGWQGQHNGRVSNKWNWVYMCTTNGGGRMNVNGKAYSYGGGSTAAPSAICTNTGGCCGGEKSNFGIAMLATFKVRLSEGEMAAVVKSMMNA